MTHTFLMLLLSFVVSFFAGCSKNTEISDLESDSTESLAEITNAIGDAGGVGFARTATPKTFSSSTKQAQGRSCALDFSTDGNLATLTLGDGIITGNFATFANEDGYFFANWDLLADKPKELKEIGSADFVSTPGTEKPCTLGKWEFVGKMTVSSAGNVVRHFLRRHTNVTGHAFFGHVEFSVLGDPSETQTLSNAKMVRGRWIGDQLMMAQTLTSVKETVATRSVSGGTVLRTINGDFCIRHLLAQRQTYVEAAGITRSGGFAGFCCHPVGGSATFSVYPFATSCMTGKPETTAESILRITFPTACGEDLTVEMLDPVSGDVTETRTGKPLCARF